MVHRAFALFAALLILAGPAAAAPADICGRNKPAVEDIQDLAARYSATPELKTLMSPFGRVLKVTIKKPYQEGLFLRLYLVDHRRIDGGDTPDVTKLHVTQVAPVQGQEAVDVYATVPSPGMLYHYWTGDYLLVAAACGAPSAVQTADASGGVISAALAPMPVFTATVYHPFSMVQRGLLWAGLTLLGIFVAGYAYYRHGLAQIVGEGAATASHRHKAIRMIFAGSNYKLSLSKFQLIVFSSVIACVVAYVAGRTGTLQELPDPVLFLLGVSVSGAFAAQLTDRMVNRITWKNWIWLKSKQAIPSPATAPMDWSELVTSHGEFDAARFQALVFTVVVALAFVFSWAYDLAAADIPNGLLLLLGASQGAYVVGKLFAPPTIAEFEKQIDEFRSKASPSSDDIVSLKAAFEATLDQPWPANASLP